MVLMPGDLVGNDWKHNLQHECFINKQKYLDKYKERRKDIIVEAIKEAKLD